ncbi:MAG TPA: hypothetical protein VN821_01180 [Candidatus Udaeobacter sp.]|nr:hypothetical protein [Candidatus Udaeobacter sp.]
MRSPLFITLVVSVVPIVTVLPAAAQQQSFTCQFSSGPRAGSTIDYAGVQGALPGQVGTPCQDGQGSSGLLVAPRAAAPPSDTAVAEMGWSATCRFTAGAKAGQIVNFDGDPNTRWGRIGRACDDGMGSTGDIVSASTPGAVRWSDGTQSPSLGFTCQFTGGPLAGRSASFYGIPGAQPGPVGAACGDSVGSTGLIRP